jgi:hypothetical protein
MENKNDTSLFTRFRNSKTIDLDDPTLKIGQTYTEASGECWRLYNQHNGKNYWMKGKGVNGRNGRCNTQFRADWNGYIVPSETVAFGKYAQGLSSRELLEHIGIADMELHSESRTKSQYCR